MTLYQRALFRLRALKLEALYLSREVVNRRINTVSERQRAAMRLRIATYKGPMATPKPVTQVPEFIKIKKVAP